MNNQVNVYEYPFKGFHEPTKKFTSNIKVKNKMTNETLRNETGVVSEMNSEQLLKLLSNMKPPEQMKFLDDLLNQFVSQAESYNVQDASELSKLYQMIKDRLSPEQQKLYSEKIYKRNYDKRNYSDSSKRRLIIY